MGSRWTISLVGLALVACARTEEVTPPTAPGPEVGAAPDVEAAPEVEAPVAVVSPTASSCAQELMRAYAIDVTPEPRICEALAQAIAPLSPEHREMVKGLVIVRDARGPCADACPDLATALMSDGALAFYRNVRRELHVLDAAFEGPRWRGGRPTPEALRALYAALDLPDWRALVERVRALPGSALAPDPPEGDPAVLDAIVRGGARTLLGGEVPLADLVRHELGHAILDALEPSPGLIGMWATLSRWTDHRGSPADGYATGVWTGERPAVAVRLVLGLPRGPSYYTPGEGLPTRYAAFDPMEDFAESLRMAHADPVALGRASPAKLLVMAAGAIDLSTPALRPFLVPGVAALLAPHVDPSLASRTLRAHADVLALEVEALRALADPRPIALPPDAHPELGAMLDAQRFPVAVGPLVLRPSDAAIARVLAEHDRYLRQRDEIDAQLRAPW
ncbi:MAG: hypothetical protein IT385_24900 [Deltaproteobacteria bacterium]|nr:hypothetical protein [Deltaproteobacteria bacterium]